MRFNLISYFIGDGIKNIAKNKKSTFTAIIIMVVTMLTVGICFVIGENAKAILNQMEEGYPIKVYISSEATEEDKAVLKEEIKQIEYVNPDNIQYINKRDAYYEAVRKLGKNQMEGYTEDEHPFPEIYVITLTDLEKLNEVVSKVESLNNVVGTTESENQDEFGDGNVVQQQEESKEQTEQKNKSPAETLTHLNRNVSIAIIVIGGALVVFSVIIIGNTIKLTVHARRKEISIMKYVGATNNFIRAPFIVEGIIIGLISSLISILLLGVLYVWFKNGILGNTVQNWLVNFSNMSSGMDKLLHFEQMFSQILMIFLAIGIGIGVFGSILSMKRYLKV